MVDISNDFFIYVIDHSHVLKTRPYSIDVSSENKPQVILKDNYDVYKLLNRIFPISKDAIAAECERFQSIVDLNRVVSILDTIPLEWTNSIVKGRVEQSKELILERINLLPSMLDLIIKEEMLND